MPVSIENIYDKVTSTMLFEDTLETDFDFDSPGLFNYNHKEQSSKTHFQKYILIALIVIIILLLSLLIFVLIYAGRRLCQCKITERSNREQNKSNNTSIYFEDENRQLILKKDCTKSSRQNTFSGNQPDAEIKNDNIADDIERKDETGIVVDSDKSSYCRWISGTFM